MSYRHSGGTTTDFISQGRILGWHHLRVQDVSNNRSITAGLSTIRGMVRPGLEKSGFPSAENAIPTWTNEHDFCCSRAKTWKVLQKIMLPRKWGNVSQLETAADLSSPISESKIAMQNNATKGDSPPTVNNQSQYIYIYIIFICDYINIHTYLFSSAMTLRWQSQLGSAPSACLCSLRKDQSNLHSQEGFCCKGATLNWFQFSWNISCWCTFAFHVTGDFPGTDQTAP